MAAIAGIVGRLAVGQNDQLLGPYAARRLRIPARTWLRFEVAIDAQIAEASAIIRQCLDGFVFGIAEQQLRLLVEAQSIFGLLFALLFRLAAIGIERIERLAVDQHWKQATEFLEQRVVVERRPDLVA